jgi:hypothetical protein
MEGFIAVRNEGGKQDLRHGAMKPQPPANRKAGNRLLQQRNKGTKIPRKAFLVVG